MTVVRRGKEFGAWGDAKTVRCGAQYQFKFFFPANRSDTQTEVINHRSSFPTRRMINGIASCREHRGEKNELNQIVCPRKMSDAAAAENSFSKIFRSAVGAKLIK